MSTCIDIRAVGFLVMLVLGIIIGYSFSIGRTR
jgi:hypothetical protein